MKTYISTTLIASFCLLWSCGGETEDNHQESVNTVAKRSNYHFESPGATGNYHLGETVHIVLGAGKEAPAWDSAMVFMDGLQLGALKPTKNSLIWQSEGSAVGMHELTAEVFGAGKTETTRRSILMLSDVIPVEYTFRVVKSYPHDEQAFTQGLVYKEGVFYEGTGQKGASELRKVEVATGQVLQRINLNNNLFGEGITLFNGHLYQLTWQAGICMVYNKATFEEVAKFNYRDEGWGITNDSSRLIMSDGTHKLRFIDPSDFNEIKVLQVYDNNGAVGFINELEWVDGLIYANIWQKDIIVMIDPVSGKVKGKIMLGGLLPSGKKKADVLNGIAYDAEKKRLFVTGKLWPNVFEIELIEKTPTSF